MKRLLVCILCLNLLPAVGFAADCNKTSVGFQPFYQSLFVPRTGAKEAAAISASHSIDRSRPFVLASLGMSNTTQEFSRFKSLADSDVTKHSNLTIVDLAQGGQPAMEWARPSSRAWLIAMKRLNKAGVSADQVNVLWVKLANPARHTAVAQYLSQLDSNLRDVIHNARKMFPQLKLVYMSSRIYAGYADTGLNPEPYAFQSAGVVDSIVNSNIGGVSVLWGPYLWADGLNARNDGLVWLCSDFANDGTHPSMQGRVKVANLLLEFFRTDSTAREWYLQKTR